MAIQHSPQRTNSHRTLERFSLDVRSSENHEKKLYKASSKLYYNPAPIYATRVLFVIWNTVTVSSYEIVELQTNL